MNESKAMSQILEEGLSGVSSPGYYQRFLAFVARNPNYSYRNVILILQQCPGASLTKGIRTWNKYGRGVKAGEKGLRINACFERDEDKEKQQSTSLRKKRERKADYTFRKVSVFDISQTRAMVGDDAQEPEHAESGCNVAAIPQRDTPDHYELMRDLYEVSAPNSFQPDKDNPCDVHTFMGRIALGWLRARCSDREQIEIAAHSITFIVCRHLGLDTAALGFGGVELCSYDKEQGELEKLLDTIQKTACYFIDTLDGIREARRIGYPTDEYFLFTNKKTAMRLFGQGHYVYLVYPGQGELLAMNKDTLAQYDGPFAVPRDEWFGVRADSLAA